LVNLLYDLQSSNEGDLHSDKTFKWTTSYFKDNVSVLGSKKSLNSLNLKQMVKIIPDSFRIDDNEISAQPSYAFPLGFEAKHQEQRPNFELLPTGSLYEGK
jgi:hypothetical protein